MKRQISIFILTLSILCMFLVRSYHQSIPGPSLIPVSHNDKILGDALEMDGLLLQMMDELADPDPVVEALFEMARDLNEDPVFEQEALDWARIVADSYRNGIVEWVRGERFVSFTDVSNNPDLSEVGNGVFHERQQVSSDAHPRLAAVTGHWEMVYEELTTRRWAHLDYLEGAPESSSGFENRLGRQICDASLSPEERTLYAIVLAAMQRHRQASEAIYAEWLAISLVEKENGKLIRHSMQAGYMAPPGKAWWQDQDGSSVSAQEEHSEPRTWDDLLDAKEDQGRDE